MRESAGYMLGEAVSTRGADHLRGSTWFGAIPGSYEGVAKSVYENQLMATITNCLEICTWNTTISGLEINLEDVASLISAVTGRDVDVVDVRDIADRVWNLERAFQVREGISRKDDVLKGRLWDEPMHGGPLDGLKVDKVKWQKMLDEYYEYNGWDKKTGIPTRARLESLGLGYIADELEQMEKTVAKK
jgi:aldehyde:ferredoxin oxidoreductase